MWRHYCVAWNLYGGNDATVEALGLAKLSIDLSAGMDRSGARDIERLVNSTLIGSAENQRRLAERFGPRPN